MSETIGTVAGLYRYPVKSMLGESRKRLALTDAGIAGDRIGAVIDQTTGKLASAKRPTPWRHLLTIQAALDDDAADPVPVLTFADGSPARADDPDAVERLSALLGRPVTLSLRRDSDRMIDRSDPDQVLAHGLDAAEDMREIVAGAAAPGAGFVDFAPVHLLLSASLARVAEIAGAAEAERFRANIVIDNAGAEPFGEHRWIGRRLAIGDTVMLTVIESTPRCAIPTLAHGTLPMNARLTHLIGTINPQPFLDRPPTACLGIYARIERAGTITPGAAVRLLD